MLNLVNKTKYPNDELIKLANFARQLLPVNPQVYVGNTKYSWHGVAWKNRIEIYIAKISKFPQQYASCYCFKNLSIPNCGVNWDDVFVEICAHEYFHSYQRHSGKISSERDAEAYGTGRLLAYLKLKGIEPPMIKPSIRQIHTVKIVNGNRFIKTRNKYIHRPEDTK